MAYTRRRNFKRRVRRNRRTYKRKRYNKKLLIGNPKQKVFYFKRFVGGLASFVAGADFADSFANYTFRLADVPGFTEFTTLFDFYKIKAVKLVFLPQFSEYSGSLMASTTFPPALRLFSIIDYNNISSPALDAMRQYSNCKITQYIKGHRRYFKPKVNFDIDGGGEGQYGKNPWINTDQSAIQYLGFRIGCDTNLYNSISIASGDVLCRVEATYYMAFKSPR